MATVAKDFKSRTGVQGTVLKSTVGTGTAPLEVASTTVVTNLNADKLDGNDASAFATVAGNLSQFGSTTSAQLAGVISDETGSDKLVFNTSTFVTSLVTSSASFDLFNTNATTINFGGAATTLNVGNASGTVTIKGNLQVDGTTTTVNSTTITVDDKNLELGSVAVPSDTTADGGGITLKGSTDKTLNWVDATDAWTSSEHFNLLTGKAYYINGASVLNATTLGTGVVNSSITKVGLSSAGFVKSDASGNLSVDTATYLTSASTLDASKLSGTIPSAVLGNSTVYIGTTAVALNRTTGALSLTGISIDGTAGKATNLVGGNNTTLLGSIPYQSNTDVTTMLAPNTTSTKKFLRQTGTGTNGAAPAWDTIVDGDIPSALTGKTYNGLTLTSNATGFQIAGGTTSKTMVFQNSITIAGTDSTTITLPSTTGTVALNNQTFYLGTTQVAINRGSGALSLAGVTIDGNAGGLDMTNAVVTSDTVTVTANSTPTTVDSFAVATYRSAQYVVQMVQGAKITTTNLLVMWDGTDVQVMEYGYVDATAGAANATLTATHATGTITVSASSNDAATTNVVIKTLTTYIKA